jgi:hypothetical protein
MSLRARPVGLFAFLLAGGSLAATGGEPPPAPPPRPAGDAPVADLIRRLGSGDFREREAATARLSALDLDRPPAELRAALTDPDPEVRRRAGLAVRAIEKQAVGRTTAPGRRFAEAGAIDRFVASSAGWSPVPDDPRLWQPALDLARRLVKESGYREQWPPAECPRAFLDVAEFRKAFSPRFLITGSSHRIPDRHESGAVLYHVNEAVVAPDAAAPWGLGAGIYVVRGPVRVKTAIGTCIVFANGSVTVGEHAANAVIVADGDVDIGDRCLGCVVVARGDIRVRRVTSQSVLVAGGSVTTEPPEQPRPNLASTVGQNEPNPFGFVTWFELAQVGVEAAEADGGVAVKSVAAGKPFAVAGVRAGDLVTKVGDHPVATPEEFRRRVRDAHAVAAEATLTVRRDGQPITVRVALPH